jgi:hypothetical protein
MTAVFLATTISGSSSTTTTAKIQIRGIGEVLKSQVFCQVVNRHRRHHWYWYSSMQMIDVVPSSVMVILVLP